jgi:predicted enzyme related to lactoylglutathione lyase
MKQGDFVWYELATTDLDAAQRFYEHVTAAWSIAPMGMPGMDYRIANVGERGVGGLMPILPEMQGQPPSWRGYIGVDDVDAMAKRVKGAGGAVPYGPDDIPQVGRFAVCTDPQGAMFMIFKGAGEPPADLSPETPGAVGWHELYTSDWQAAWSFYSGLFGWEKAIAVDMGGAGTYQTFNINGRHAGGMMNVPGEAPAWVFYITVDDIKAATKRISDSGAAILNGPMEVPGGSWIVQARDPQGAAFAFSGPNKG